MRYKKEDSNTGKNKGNAMDPEKQVRNKKSSFLVSKKKGTGPHGVGSVTGIKRVQQGFFCLIRGGKRIDGGGDSQQNEGPQFPRFPRAGLREPTRQNVKSLPKGPQYPKKKNPAPNKDNAQGGGERGISTPGQRNRGINNPQQQTNKE